MRQKTLAALFLNRGGYEKFKKDITHMSIHVVITLYICL